MNYEQWMLALCLWREARGQTREALIAIYHTIINRRNDGAYRWPRDIVKVITQAKQFSSFNAGDPNATKFPQAPNAGTNPSEDWKAWQECINVVSSLYGSGATISEDPTNGANHYESLPEHYEPWPQWADKTKITVTVAPFRFYKL